MSPADQITTILHPTDFSPCSREAFRYAEALASKYHAKLTVLHVLESEPAVFGAGMVESNPEFVEAQLAELRAANPEVEARLAAIHTADPAVPIDHVIHAGPPADVIIWYARHRRCDLIVMGTHGYSGLKHFLLGSVAEKVIRIAPCTVLVVRALDAAGLSSAEEQPKPRE